MSGRDQHPLRHYLERLTVEQILQTPELLQKLVVLVQAQATLLSLAPVPVAAPLAADWLMALV